MDALCIRGGKRLQGEWTVHAAKNAVLPIMAATILTRDPTTLMHCPLLSDIEDMGQILKNMGCQVHRNDKALVIDPAGLCRHDMPDDLAKKIRSSIFMLGPILARCHQATVTFPGGCEIGLRPIDLHLSGLRQLGVVIGEEGGVIHCDGSHMRSGVIHFDYPSVGATENVMMASVLLKGKTLIHNPAREPEIIDLQRFLNAMGAHVVGAGTDTIVVEGVSELRGVTYEPMADRIVAGTLLGAVAITGGALTLHRAPVNDMYAMFSKLREMGCVIHQQAEDVVLHAPEKLTAFDQLQTQPHPGFPTDMQAQMLSLATVAKGTSIVVENVFENRFMHVGDLNRLGANVIVKDRTAIIKGVDALYGAKVSARDLRGGAALVMAGLKANGETLIDNVSFIDRGYEHLETMLSALGADIKRVSLRS